MRCDHDDIVDEWFIDFDNDLLYSSHICAAEEVDERARKRVRKDFFNLYLFWSSMVFFLFHFLRFTYVIDITNRIEQQWNGRKRT